MRNCTPILLALALFTCGSSCEPTYLDNGFLVVDGLELHPGVLPFVVSVDETVEDATLIPEVVEWWNDQVGAEVLLVASPDDVSQVTVSVGLVPLDGSDEDVEDGPAGIAYLDFDEDDGTLLGAEVVLSSDIAYDREMLLLSGLHEVGCHATLALADDPGPPVTVDLRSICSDPLDPLGVLTGHDRDLLEPYLP